MGSGGRCRGWSKPKICRIGAPSYCSLLPNKEHINENIGEGDASPLLLYLVQTDGLASAQGQCLRIFQEKDQGSVQNKAMGFFGLKLLTMLRQQSCNSSSSGVCFFRQALIAEAALELAVWPRWTRTCNPPASASAAGIASMSHHTELHNCLYEYKDPMASPAQEHGFSLDPGSLFYLANQNDRTRITCSLILSLIL